MAVSSLHQHEGLMQVPATLGSERHLYLSHQCLKSSVNLTSLSYFPGLKRLATASGKIREQSTDQGWYYNKMLEAARKAQCRSQTYSMNVKVVCLTPDPHLILC